MPRPRKIWRSVLAGLASDGRNPGTFTAGDVSDDAGISYPSAAQLLKRLQMWGCVRVIGFAPPDGKSGRGRRRKVFELTDHGRNAAKWKPR